MRRFLVAVMNDDGGVGVHPMKSWLREHPDEIPPGSDPTSDTSHQLRGALKKLGWMVKEMETEVRLVRPCDTENFQRINEVLGDDDEEGGGGSDVDGGPEHEFGLESHLRDFLAQNIENTSVGGRKVRLYVDATGRDGVEYPTDGGRIDILAVDQDGAFVVFELKRARAADRAVGQLMRYMGWVKSTIGKDQPVYGVIVAKRITKSLRYAATVVPGVSLLEYTVEFHLHPADSLPDVR